MRRIVLISCSVLHELVPVLLDSGTQAAVVFEVDEDFVERLVVFDQLRDLKGLVGVQPVFLLKRPEGLEDYGLRENFNLADVLILELKDGLLGRRSEQVNGFHLDRQPHVVGHLEASLLQFLVAVVVRLHVEQIGAEDGVGLDLVEHYLAAEVLMTEVEALLADCFCLDPVVLQLVPVVLYYLLYLLVDALEMVPASLEPLLFTVVLQFEDSVGDDFVDQLDILLGDALRLALRVDVEVHGQEEDVLVEGQLILHVLYFREDLVDDEAKSCQVLPYLCLLDLEGEVVVFLEDEGRRLAVEALGEG